MHQNNDILKCLTPMIKSQWLYWCVNLQWNYVDYLGINNILHFPRNVLKDTC